MKKDQPSLRSVLGVLTVKLLVFGILFSPLAGTVSTLNAQTGRNPLIIDSSTARILADRSRIVRKVRDSVRARNVPFDPILLFTKNWRQRLKPIFDQMPQMVQARIHHNKKLKGVEVVGELTLPDTVELTGDTIIIAKKVRFTGRNVVIKGPYDFHAFTVDSFGTEHPNGNITIDTSGHGHREWLEAQRANNSGLLAKSTTGKDKGFVNASFTPPTLDTIDNSGVTGSTGTTGAPGGNPSHGVDGGGGADGTCGGNKNGSPGINGTHGGAGGNGGNGGNGGAGANGGTVTLAISNANMSTSYILRSNGGDGGPGGPAGGGTSGGVGGDGGDGGDGASCNCQAGGLGIGGNGGNGGNAGAGGNGGTGGNGGKGGDGGPISVHYPTGYNLSQITTSNTAGIGGAGGSAGSAGNAGTPGDPGSPGSGGDLVGCNANNGNPGTAGNGASGGTAGAAGAAGAGGTNGPSPSFTSNGAPPSGGGGGGGYEPGEGGNGCTDWYWVEYWCYPLQSLLKPKRIEEVVAPTLNERRSFGERFLRTASIPPTASAPMVDYWCEVTSATWIGCF
jgi:hypothetical protein